MRIREFQELIARIYLTKDRKRGVERTYIWLVEEIGELARALRKGDTSHLAEEMADVLAWLASVASLLDIDLEEASRRYVPGCPKCRELPCACAEPKLGASPAPAPVAPAPARTKPPPGNRRR